jgi:spore maturation protein CgeB
MVDRNIVQKDQDSHVSYLQAVGVKKQKILFIGHGGLGSNALSLFEGFRSIVDSTVLIDTKYFDAPSRYSIRRVTRKLFPILYGYYASIFIDLRIRKQIKIEYPDFIFVFKGNYVKRSSLSKINVPKVHYHPDDSSNLANRTSIFNKAESSYDIHFTSKKHNIEEILERTGKRVHFVWYAYDDRWHFRNSAADFRNPIFEVGFIGHMRPDRAQLVLDIAKRFGKSFAITGAKWNKVEGLAALSSVFPPSYASSFSRFVASAPLQLGLLNSDNRDQHTARSFEVPAAGGLLLAEDTPEHREIFVSDANALFFKTKEELFSKISWVQTNPELAKKIAENGYQHITRNHNTWRDRSSEMLLVINKLRT